MYFYIVCDYCEKCFRSLNDSIIALSESTHLLLRISSIDEIIVKHNILCRNISNYNKFWQKYYFAIIFTTKPMLLLLLHQIVFESLVPAAFLAVVMLSLLTFISKVLLKFMTANISEEALDSYTLLYEVYIKFNSALNVKRKLDVSNKF
jgi:hypothetical protein